LTAIFSANSAPKKGKKDNKARLAGLVRRGFRGSINRRCYMPELGRFGVGSIIFLIGAVIYIVNLIIALSRRGKALPLDGVGLMVLGIGLALLFRW
jgi:hypothetical protein